MITIWRIRKLNSFSKIDLKGAGKWFLAAFIINFIASRLGMSKVDGTTEVYMMYMPFLIPIAIYFCAYNPFINLPQFTSDLPYTYKQEVLRSILMFLASLFLVFIYAVIIVAAVSIYGKQIPFDFSHIAEDIRSLIFNIEYYMIIIALLFPLGMIRSKKIWYCAFGFVVIIFGAVSLYLINFANEFNGFITYGRVFENIVFNLKCDQLLVVMGVFSIITVICSIQISFLLHRPKRYKD